MNVRLIAAMMPAIFFLCACSGDNRIKAEMEQFYGQHVTLPLDSMLHVTDSERWCGDVANYYKLVVYYDSTECSSCRLKTLYEWGSLIDSVKNSRSAMDFYFIFHVPARRLEDVKSTLVTYAGEMPVYIDTAGVFERSNPCLPHLSQMRTFMLNGKDTVVLVGNPIYNKRVAKMMWNTICNRDE